MSNSGAKKFQKGEILFNENDPISSFFFIQSGRVKYFIPRGRGIEFQVMNAPFVVGELALFNNNKYPVSAMAMTEVTAFEFNLETAKLTVDSAPQFFKTLVKSLVENVRNLSTDLKSYKLEQSPLPCPPELIPRIFGGTFHTINHTGTALDDGRIEVDWSVMKKYTHRIFNIPIEKVEAVNNLMAKFGNVEFKYEKDEDDPNAPEQLTKVYYRNHQLLEVFFEFYQFYFYKSGKQDILKYEESVFNMVRGILLATKDLSPDRQGVIKVPLNAVLEKIKSDFGLNVTASHWQLLENKGLFSKRAQMSDGTFMMSFHLDDFDRTYTAWRFLREISKWNDTGSINPKDPEFPPVVALPEANALCPDCKAPINSQQKFCGECGAKITSKAS